MIYTKHEDTNVKHKYYYIVRRTDYDNHISYNEVFHDKDDTRLPSIPCADTIKELKTVVNLKFTKVNPNQSFKEVITDLFRMESDDNTKEYKERILKLDFTDTKNFNLFQEIINQYAFFN